MSSLNPLRKLKKLIEHSPFESLSKEPTGIIKGVIDSTKDDLIKQATTDMWKQILMPDQEKSNGNEHGGQVEMHAGEEFDLTGHGSDNDSKAEKAGHSEAEPHMNYRRDILHYRERENSKETQEVNYQVKEILVELRRLVDSTSIISAELSAVSVSQAPAEVGKYHINFFEWMLITLQAARMKVEDSGAWLSSMSGKKGKKDYWSEFKKHGTSFGMSSERSTATQTG